MTSLNVLNFKSRNIILEKTKEDYIYVSNRKSFFSSNNLFYNFDFNHFLNLISKNNQFDLKKELKHMNGLKQEDLNNNLYLFNAREKQPISIHSFTDKEGSIVIGLIYLNVSDRNNNILNIQYFVKKGNMTYIEGFNIQNELSHLNFDDEHFIYHLYEMNKEYLYNTTVKQSYKNMYDSFVLQDTFKNIFEINENGFKDFIINVFPFMYKFKESEYESIYDYHPFLRTLLDEVYFSFKGLLDVPSYREHSTNYNNEQLTSLLKETEPLKQVKCIIPKANKNVMKALQNLFSFTRNLDNPEYYSKHTVLYINLLNLFNNQDKLAEFINHIDIAQTDEELMNIHVKIDKENTVNKFIVNHLRDFFTSQKKMEDYFVDTIKKLSKEKIDEALEYACLIEGDYEEEFNEDDDYDNVSNFELNLSAFNEKIYNLNYLYSRSLDLLSKLENSEDEKDKIKTDLLKKAMSLKTNDLDVIHDKISNAYNFVTDNQVIFEKTNLTLLEEDEMVISEVETNYELKKVGNEMHHCVGTYVEEIKDKRTAIFVVKNKETNQYVGCLEYARKENKIVQAKSKYNFLIRDKKALNLIKKFKEINNLKIDTYDLVHI